MLGFVQMTHAHNNDNDNDNNNNGNLQWHFHKVALHPLFPDRIRIYIGFTKR